MRDKSVEAMRVALTITGLLLLFVFGARAASQARDMSLAGASHRSITPNQLIANVARLNPWLVSVPTAARAVMTERAQAAGASQAASKANQVHMQQTTTTTVTTMNMLQAAVGNEQATSNQYATPQQSNTQDAQRHDKAVTKQKGSNNPESVSATSTTATAAPADQNKKVE